MMVTVLGKGEQKMRHAMLMDMMEMYMFGMCMSCRSHFSVQTAR